MHADDLVVNYGTAGKAVEGITERFPQFNTEAATAFIIKPIYAINAGTFVISP